MTIPVSALRPVGAKRRPFIVYRLRQITVAIVASEAAARAAVRKLESEANIRAAYAPLEDLPLARLSVRAEDRPRIALTEAGRQPVGAARVSATAHNELRDPRPSRLVLLLEQRERLADVLEQVRTEWDATIAECVKNRSVAGHVMNLQRLEAYARSDRGALKRLGQSIAAELAKLPPGPTLDETMEAARLMSEAELAGGQS